jgi:hypothetical protein
MRFLSIYKHVERNVPPTAEEMARMGALIEEGMKAGWLLGTEGCLPSALGARVRRDGGKVTVSDGPFTEAKEVVGGYWLIQARSKEEALEWASRCPSENCRIEVRRVFEMEDFPQDVQDAAAENFGG